MTNSPPPLVSTTCLGKILGFFCEYYWDGTPCSLVDMTRYMMMMMEAAGTSEMSVEIYTYPTTRRYIVQDNYIQDTKSLIEKAEGNDPCIRIWKR